MTQRDLDREIARATGETVSTIRNLGFGLVEMPAPEPLTVDWDELAENRVAVFPHRQRQHAAARSHWRLPSFLDARGGRSAGMA